MNIETSEVYALMSKNEKNNMRSNSANFIRNGSGNKRQEIQVCTVGETIVLPDTTKLLMVIHSTKDAANDAKLSVNRRLEYVKQVLRNHEARDIKVSSWLSHQNSDYTMDSSVSSVFLDSDLCEAASNLLTEKLGDSVRLEDIVVTHSLNKLEGARKEATMIAVKSAKQKAIDLAATLKHRVGLPISVREDSLVESQVEESPAADHSRLLLKTEQAAIRIRSTVTCLFEMKPQLKEYGRSQID